MNRTQYRTLTLLSLLLAIAVVVALVMASSNRTLQAEVNARQQYVQQSVQLEGLFREIARALAELGARHNDAQVRELLQRHGITYTVNANPAPAATTPTAKK